MKYLIKKLLKRNFHHIITGLGYEESAKLQTPNMLDDFFKRLKVLNFNPVHIVDVGANHGNWTRTSLNFFPDAYYSLLEPQEWLKESMMDILHSNKKVSFHAIGAGSKNGSFKFTVVDRDDSSSFRFSEEIANKHGFRQVDIPVVTLNEFIHAQNLPIPDIIKIDAEGLDIEVLDGASDFFGKTEIFMVEAAIGLKDIENSILKIINYMENIGYRVYDFTDLNRPFLPDVLWLTEIAKKACLNP